MAELLRPHGVGHSFERVSLWGGALPMVDREAFPMTVIPEFSNRGNFTSVEIATMQLVHLTVCANHLIAPEDSAARSAIALAILTEFELSQHDVDAAKAAAIIAAKEVMHAGRQIEMPEAPPH
ncbi:MAG: hypothetical protein J0H01_08460 [Rhizobiales bacterium]|nr:hypothetical protein [Hyphomicrobiales bacterium]